MDYKKCLDEMDKIFIKLGFIPTIINNIKFMRYKECFCKVTFLKDWNVYVIETAENYQEAEKGLLEDSGIYNADLSEKELLNQFRLDLIKYYMDK